MRYVPFLVLALFAALPLRATLGADAPPPDALPPDLGTRKAGVDWPDFLGAHRNARSPETGLPNFAAAPPRLVWQCGLGESYAAPTISRGRLFHFDRTADVHRLTCLNSETGAELWRHDMPADYVDMLGYNNGPRCTPVVDGDRVYVASPEGRIECVRAVDGQPVWSVDTIKKFGIVKNFFGIGSTPIIWGDFLIANIGGSPAGSPPDVYTAQGRVDGNGTGVVAFDKRTGEVKWQATDELASYASPVIAEVDGRARCFVFARGGLVALDPSSGKVDFQFPWRSAKLESVNASSPVVVNNDIFISESYGEGSVLLRMLSPVGGVSDADGGLPRNAKSASETPPTILETPPTIVWSDKKRGRDKAFELHWNTAVFHDGYLYASSGQHSGEADLRCVEWATGEVKWRQPGLGRSSLLFVDGCFVCLSEEGELRLLRATPEKYTVLADITPKDAQGEPLLTTPAWTAPVLSHGLLYVRGKGRLVCLELIPDAAAQ